MTGVRLRRPRRRKRTILGCRYPPGLKLAEDTSEYSDQVLGFGRLEWEWSLRGDGRAWIRLVRYWYWQDGELVPVRKREPKTWYEVGTLTGDERDRLETGQLTPGLALAKVMRARGHAPGSENGHAPWIPPAPPVKPTLLGAPAGAHHRNGHRP